MPMGEGGPFQSPAYGVFTAGLSSAAILNDRFPEQAMVFGNGQAHLELLGATRPVGCSGTPHSP